MCASACWPAPPARSGSGSFSESSSSSPSACHRPGRLLGGPTAMAVAAMAAFVASKGVLSSLQSAIHRSPMIFPISLEVMPGLSARMLNRSDFQKDMKADEALLVGGLGVSVGNVGVGSCCKDGDRDAQQGQTSVTR